MQTRRLGTNGPLVGAIGLGCGGLSHGQARDDDAGIALIHAALDAGINLLNTADFYGMGHNEALIGRAIAGRRDAAFLSVKFGMMMSPSRAFLGLDGRPAAVKNFASYSLQRLGVDVIDLYQAGRPDPAVPYEETIGAIAELIQEGKVRHLGVSEVGVDHLRRAHAIHPVSALEIEYSLACRFIEPEILPAARELGIAIVPYRVLADGLLSRTGAPSGGHGAFPVPRMQGDDLVHNTDVAAVLDDLAVARGVTPSQLAVAWLLTQGDDIIPLVGMSKISRLFENLVTLDIKLTGDERAALDRAFAPGAIRGNRYPPFVMKFAAR